MGSIINRDASMLAFRVLLEAEDESGVWRSIIIDSRGRWGKWWSPLSYGNIFLGKDLSRSPHPIRVGGSEAVQLGGRARKRRDLVGLQYKIGFGESG